MKKTLNRVLAVFIMIEVVIGLCFYYRPVDPFPTVYRERHKYYVDKIGGFPMINEDILFADDISNLLWGNYEDNYTEFYKMNSSFILDEKVDFLSIRIDNTDKFIVKLRLPYERIEKYDYYTNDSFFYTTTSILFIDGKKVSENEFLYYFLKPVQRPTEYSDKKPIDEGIKIDKRCKSKDIVNKLFIDFTFYFDGSVYKPKDYEHESFYLSIEERSKDNHSLYGKLSTQFVIGGH